MTNPTGTPTLTGLFGNLFEAIENVTGLVQDVFEEKVGGSDQSEGEETAKEYEPKAQYKAVFNLGLSDQLVLNDGSWQVIAIEEDGFDADRVSVYLDNGECYDLIRTSLVWVV